MVSAGKPPAALRLGGQLSQRDLGPVSHGPSGREAKEVEGAASESGWPGSPAPGRLVC